MKLRISTFARVSVYRQVMTRRSLNMNQGPVAHEHGRAPTRTRRENYFQIWTQRKHQQLTKKNGPAKKDWKIQIWYIHSSYFWNHVWFKFLFGVYSASFLFFFGSICYLFLRRLLLVALSLQLYFWICQDFHDCVWPSCSLGLCDDLGRNPNCMAKEPCRYWRPPPISWLSRSCTRKCPGRQHAAVPKACSWQHSLWPRSLWMCLPSVTSVFNTNPSPNAKKGGETRCCYPQSARNILTFSLLFQIFAGDPVVGTGAHTHSMRKCEGRTECWGSRSLSSS